MQLGYVLCCIGLLLAVMVFVLSYEYPTMMERGFGAMIAIGCLILIVTGAISASRTHASKTAVPS